MSSLNSVFECHWRPSVRLLACYAGLCLSAGLAIYLSNIAPSAKAVLWLMLVVHIYWVLPRRLLLSHPSAWRGLRHDRGSWQLYNHALGWQAVQLKPYSVALPIGISLSVVVPGKMLPQSLFIAYDALPEDVHRRLRVRLKFSRQRWVATE